MKNRLTEMFGIEYPIFAFSHCRDVVAAVTNAGGMGVLGALAFSPEQLELELQLDRRARRRQALRRRRGDAGQDRRPRRRPRRRQRHRRQAPRAHLARSTGTTSTRSCADHGVDPWRPTSRASSPAPAWAPACSAGPRPPARRRSTSPCPHPIALLASALGPPPKAAIDQAHEQGVKVAALIGRVEQAERDVAARRRHHHRPGLRGRRPHRRGGDDGAHPRRGRRHRPRARARRPAASAPAARWRRPWRSAPTACGPARSGSPSPRTTRRPIVTEKLLAATSTDTVRSRASPASRPASCAPAGPRRGRRRSRPARCRCRCSSSSTPTPPSKMGSNPPRELVGMPVGQIVSRMNSVRTHQGGRSRRWSRSTSTSPPSMAADLED